jgi:hypothetical protein
MLTDEVVEKKFGEFGRSYSSVGRHEYSPLRESIDDDENRIVAIGFRQRLNEVHADIGPWSRWNFEGFQVPMALLSRCLRPLADSTS